MIKKKTKTSDFGKMLYLRQLSGQMDWETAPTLAEPLCLQAIKINTSKQKQEYFIGGILE